MQGLNGAFEALQLDASVVEMLQRYHFDMETWSKLRARLAAEGCSQDLNVVTGELRAASASDIPRLPPLGTKERLQLECLGASAIAKGQVAVMVLAGGMATRFQGAVKALVPVHNRQTFAELKLQTVAHAAHQYQVAIPMWWMTSFATHEPLERWLATQHTPRVPLSTLTQSVSLRLTPEGSIFEGSHPLDCLYAPGHGDALIALQRTSLLNDFAAAGGRYVFVSNVDNLVATLDAAVIGAHIKSGLGISVELVSKKPGDQGGAPAWYDGRLQIIEAFRFPADFDQASIPVFNTNSFVFNLDVLQGVYPLDWFAVTKKQGEQTVIQYERLLGQLTAFVPSNYLLVERDGWQSRFIAVKTPQDLEGEQQSILETLRARGVRIAA